MTEENEQGQRIGDWMSTYTGRKFWPMDPDYREIDILDIARALSMQCRYNGHVKKFYSVAEHCWLVSLACPEYPLWGLLHDASEAYLSDIIRPVKPYLQEYIEAEKNLMVAVCRRFALYPVMPQAVKEADNRILVDEARALLTCEGKDWNLPYEPLGAAIIGLPPEEAEKLFLHRFAQLTAGRQSGDIEGSPYTYQVSEEERAAFNALLEKYPEYAAAGGIQERKDLTLAALRPFCSFIDENLKTGNMSGKEFRIQVSKTMGTEFPNEYLPLVLARMYHEAITKSHALKMIEETT